MTHGLALGALDDVGRDSGRGKAGGNAVPGIVEADDPDAGGLGDACERAAHIARLDRAAGAGW